MEDGRINTATGQLMLGAFDTSGTPFGGLGPGSDWTISKPNLEAIDLTAKRSGEVGESSKVVKVILGGIVLGWITILTLGISHFIL